MMMTKMTVKQEEKMSLKIKKRKVGSFLLVLPLNMPSIPDSMSSSATLKVLESSCKASMKM